MLGVTKTQTPVVPESELTTVFIELVGCSQGGALSAVLSRKQLVRNKWSTWRWEAEIFVLSSSPSAFFPLKHVAYFNSV